jgi:hypothetical protein
MGSRQARASHITSMPLDLEARLGLRSKMRDQAWTIMVAGRLLSDANEPQHQGSIASFREVRRHVQHTCPHPVQLQ